MERRPGAHATCGSQSTVSRTPLSLYVPCSECTPFLSTASVRARDEVHTTVRLDEVRAADMPRAGPELAEVAGLLDAPLSDVGA
jgi:hypothetical protein